MGIYWEFLGAAIDRVYLRIRHGLSPYKNLVVLSGCDEELDYYAVAHIHDLMERFYLRKAIVMSPNITEFIALQAARQGLNIQPISPRQERRIKTAFRTHDDYIRFAALDFPTENMNHRLVGIGGFTKEDVLCLAAFQLFTFERAMPYEKAKERADKA